MTTLTHHIHLMGAPGAGVTTLGKMLAERLGIPHFDTDDYHWFTADPEPYRRRRNPDHRRQLLQADLDASSQWVLSGSLCGWGDVFVSRFTAVIWCLAPAAVRVARIRAREAARYAPERLAPGGDLHGVFVKFLEWAAAYDEPSGRVRTRDFEETWLQTHCYHIPVMTLNGEEPPEVAAEKVLAHLGGLSMPPK